MEDCSYDIVPVRCYYICEVQSPSDAIVLTVRLLV